MKKLKSKELNNIRGGIISTKGFAAVAGNDNNSRRNCSCNGTGDNTNQANGCQCADSGCQAQQ